MSSGIQYDKKDQILYNYIPNNTDITNCPIGITKGDFHLWINKEKNFVCKKCGTHDDNVNGDYDSTNDSYYFNMNKIANRRCIDGRLHDFVGKDDKEFICTNCNHNLENNILKKN